MRRYSVIAILVLLYGLLTAPANAIVGGSADGDRHPNVGILLGVDLRSGGYIGLYSCSGTLVAPDRFLTNAHCLPGGLPFSEELAAQGLVVDELRISFATAFAPGRDLLGQVADIKPYITAKTWAANPDYSPTGPLTNEKLANDLAVVTLAKPARLVFPRAEPATLPPAGHLATTAKRDYRLVGYGQQIALPPLKDDRFFDATRRVASAKEESITESLVYLRGVPQSDSPDDSGVACQGDSGGAIFQGAYLVGVIAASDNDCHKFTVGPRLDGAIARDFLRSLHLSR
jgi:hypothetical protein